MSPLTLTPTFQYYHNHSCGVWLYFVVGLDYVTESSHCKYFAPAILSENEKEQVW